MAEETAGKYLIFGMLLGGATALFGIVQSDRKSTIIRNTDLDRTATAYEVIDSSKIDHIRKDTVVVIPLNASELFNKGATRAIKNGQLKVVPAKGLKF